MTNFLSYARGPHFMGRKLVRENQLLQLGGLLSFPRTGCALCTGLILSRRQHEPNAAACPTFALFLRKVNLLLEPVLFSVLSKLRAHALRSPTLGQRQRSP